MPLIHVYLPAGLVDAATRRVLGERMAVSLLEVERIPDTPSARAMSWVFWHEMPEGSWTVPGLDATTPRCLIEIVAPEGLLDGGQKAAAVERMTADVLALWGAADTLEARLRIWVVIRDVPDGSWGVAGCIAPSAMILSGLGGVPAG